MHSQAGCSFSLNPAGYWWAAASAEEWPEEESVLADIRSNFHEPYGDRRQELVFIGQYMDETEVRAALDECLLTEEEFAAGPAVWDAFDDPFPEVVLEDEAM